MTKRKPRGWSFVSDTQTRCLTCEKVKRHTEFYRKKDGRIYAHCRGCIKNRVVQWRRNNPEQRRESARGEYARRKEANLLSSTAWHKRTPRGKSAHSLVYQATQKGKLIRPEVCASCHKKAKYIQAHHHRGYDYPLDVQWLCVSCHKLIHIKERMQVNA